MRPRLRRRTWRAFDGLDRILIETRVTAGGEGQCPRCGEMLEARPRSRLCRVLPAGTRGFDLDCRSCRRFLSRIDYSPASLRALRVRRLAAAVLRS